jgi:hypothetical protein
MGWVGSVVWKSPPWATVGFLRPGSRLSGAGFTPASGSLKLRRCPFILRELGSWCDRKPKLFSRSASSKRNNIWALVAQACNPSYLGGWDWEDCGLRPTWQIVHECPSPK